MEPKLAILILLITTTLNIIMVSFPRVKYQDVYKGPMEMELYIDGEKIDIKKPISFSVWDKNNPYFKDTAWHNIFIQAYPRKNKK